MEFVTVMWFDSIEAVRAFAGEDYEVAVVPPKARALLSRFDAHSQHYEVKAEMKPEKTSRSGYSKLQLAYLKHVRLKVSRDTERVFLSVNANSNLNYINLNQAFSAKIT